MANKSPPVVSYVVTVYNKRPYLSELTESIVGQGVRPAEIVFSDDGSTDGSVALIESLAQTIQASDLTVRICRSTANMGPSKAINTGIAASTGTWVHCVDGDDVLPAEATSSFIMVAEQTGSDFIYGQKLALEVAAGETASRLDYRVYPDALSALIKLRLVGMRFFCSRALANIGADERVFIQDVSLAYRIAYQARSLAVLNQPVVRIRDVASSVSKGRMQEHADFVGAASLFLSDFDVPREVRNRILQRCFARMRKHGDWSAAAWELLVAGGLTPRRPNDRIIRAFLRLHAEHNLRRGCRFDEIPAVGRTP